MGKTVSQSLLPVLFKSSSVKPQLPHPIMENLDSQYSQLFLNQSDPPPTMEFHSGPFPQPETPDLSGLSTELMCTAIHSVKALLGSNETANTLYYPLTGLLKKALDECVECEEFQRALLVREMVLQSGACLIPHKSHRYIPLPYRSK